jgi:hypothetical protein
MRQARFRRSLVAAAAIALACAGAAPLRAQLVGDDEGPFSSLGFAMGYNTFSPASQTRFVTYASHFKSTGGFAMAVRLLWSPNILGRFLSFGGEYQSLNVATSESGTWYYVDSGKPTAEYDGADLWQLLIGMMFVNNESVIVQGQVGYGSWKCGTDFSESVVTARLVTAFPILGRNLTVDPEIAYYKGLGAFKNSAFSIQIGLSFRI